MKLRPKFIADLSFIACILHVNVFSFFLRNCSLCVMRILTTTDSEFTRSIAQPVPVYRYSMLVNDVASYLICNLLFQSCKVSFSHLLRKNYFKMQLCWQILACVVCPLLIPLFAPVKQQNEATNGDKKDCLVVRQMKNVGDFYKTPRVKYYSHSVQYFLLPSFFNESATISDFGSSRAYQLAYLPVLAKLFLSCFSCYIIALFFTREQLHNFQDSWRSALLLAANMLSCVCSVDTTCHTPRPWHRPHVPGWLHISAL